MNIKVRPSVVAVFFISFCFWNVAVAQLPQDPIRPMQELPFSDSSVSISMDLQDASLKDVLKIFSIQSGLNFIASEAVQDRKITLYLDGVPIHEAMNKIFMANNLSYELDEDSNIFIVRDWGTPRLQTVTRIYALKHRPVPSSTLQKEKASLLSTGTPDLLNSLKQVMTDNGRVSEDITTNSLIITDVPSVFPEVEEIIKTLDVPQTQILLDVEILDVNKNVVDAMGFEFNTTPFTLVLPGEMAKRGVKQYFGLAATRGAEGALTLGHTYAQTFEFLRTQTDTKYLARPRLLTLNNETAEIKITKDEIVGDDPTSSVSTASGDTTTSIVNHHYIRATDLSLTKEGVGIYLRMTPQVNPDTEEITMVINPKSSVTTPSSLASGYSDPEVRETRSVVKIKNGETVVVGGLIHTDKQVTKKKVPIVGDIPFIGMLFRHKDQAKDAERELIVFITPRIIKDSAAGPTYDRRPSLPAEREQSARSAVERQSVINSSLNKMERMK